MIVRLPWAQETSGSNPDAPTKSFHLNNLRRRGPWPLLQFSAVGNNIENLITVAKPNRTCGRFKRDVEDRRDSLTNRAGSYS